MYTHAFFLSMLEDHTQLAGLLCSSEVGSSKIRPEIYTPIKGTRNNSAGTDVAMYPGGWGKNLRGLVLEHM